MEAHEIAEVLQKHHVEWIQHLDSWLHKLEFKLCHHPLPEGSFTLGMGSHSLGNSGLSSLGARREQSRSFNVEQEKSGEARAASPSPSSPQLPHNLTEPAVESSGSHLVPPLANTDRGSRRKQKFSRAPTAENRYMSAKVRGNAVEYFKRQQTAEEDDSTRTWLQLQIRALSRRCATIANSLWFNGLFALVIITNAIFMGVQLEWVANSMDVEMKITLVAVSFVYAVLFSVEMAVRIIAAGPMSYFFSTGAGWNWLDVLVVVPAWLELAIELGALDAFGGSGSASQFRIIRVFKVTRLLQVVRSIRLVRFLSALRALVLSVIDTTRQLLWALMLLGLVQYSFGIMFTDAVLDYQFEHGQDAILTQYFGTVYDSCATLFRSILGGTDWEHAADALQKVGMVWVQLFHAYIAFCGFAVLNVMMGVFVNSAIKTRERDHETLIQNKQKFKELVSRIWKKMDVTGQGEITIIEFERMFDDEEMKAFFQSIEINAVDAWTLFDSLDVNGDHTISLEEFSTRCIQLHGPARSVDLYALKKEFRHLEDNQMHLSEQLADVLMNQLGRITRVPRPIVESPDYFSA